MIASIIRVKINGTHEVVLDRDDFLNYLDNLEPLYKDIEIPHGEYDEESRTSRITFLRSHHYQVDILNTLTEEVFDSQIDHFLLPSVDALIGKMSYVLDGYSNDEVPPLNHKSFLKEVTLFKLEGLSSGISKKQVLENLELQVIDTSIPVDLYQSVLYNTLASLCSEEVQSIDKVFEIANEYRMEYEMRVGLGLDHNMAVELAEERIAAHKDSLVI
ncbi:hypothetical protein [Ekhidna sp.]|uniref:hypothetical protein n=1 Tax=Ekhidna sp. TaxID=2608089 RepID=UPI0032975F43